VDTDILEKLSASVFEVEASSVSGERITFKLKTELKSEAD
jgi:hypothetical protein